MKVALNDGAKMPTRAHPWDGGLDLYAMDFRFIKANGKPCLLPKLELVKSLDRTDRGNGGFGSTGR